jgi:hypothetical protein
MRAQSSDARIPSINASSRRKTATCSSRARESCLPRFFKRRSASTSFCSMRSSRESGSEFFEGGTLEGRTLRCIPEVSLGNFGFEAESTVRISEWSPLSGSSGRRMGGIRSTRLIYEPQRCRFHSVPLHNRRFALPETASAFEPWENLARDRTSRARLSGRVSAYCPRFCVDSNTVCDCVSALREAAP